MIGFEMATKQNSYIYRSTESSNNLIWYQLLGRLRITPFTWLAYREHRARDWTKGDVYSSWVLDPKSSISRDPWLPNSIQDSLQVL